MIYLDCSATTAVDKEVLEAMLPYFSEVYGNGSSQHAAGRMALKAIDNARSAVAKNLNCKQNEIYFTSGGTEGNNWIIKGIAEAYQDKGKHIITSCIEHPSLMKACESLEKKGFSITYLPVDGEGFVSVSDLEKAITDDTILISIMLANNEIGTLQPIKELAEVAKKYGVLFHTDAVQAVGSVNVDIANLGVDMLTVSAHKFYGPKGVGAVYKRNGVRLSKYMSGGEQERNSRAGTLNTAGIVGLGVAIEKACANVDEYAEYVASLRDAFVDKVLKAIPDVNFNGAKDMSKRLCSNASFSFEFIEGESLLLRLDLEGIAVSSGSACSSGSLEPSYVLLATGLPIERAHGTIRFSFGKGNTMSQVDEVVEKLKKIVTQLREMSPLFKQFEGEKTYV